MLVLLDIPHWPERGTIECINVQIVTTEDDGLGFYEGLALWHQIAESMKGMRDQLNEVAPNKRKCTA